jgi:TPP-dependent indolepyruvate ferredoxin oxidoreductase alpha subunit
MSFAYAVTDRTVYGNHRVVSGTFTNAEADSGGAISTGLDYVAGFSCVPTSHVASTMPKVTASAGTITIVTDNGVDGNWIAFGL